MFARLSGAQIWQALGERGKRHRYRASFVSYLNSTSSTRTENSVQKGLNSVPNRVVSVQERGLGGHLAADLGKPGLEPADGCPEDDRDGAHAPIKRMALDGNFRRTDIWEGDSLASGVGLCRVSRSSVQCQPCD